MLSQITAKDLLKTTGIISVSPETTLAQALSKLKSSHDVVFVSQDKKLHGVVSPYHSLYRHNHPPETKVKNSLFSPPKLFLHTKLPEIARRMVESKAYFLPVISDNNSWIGIVTKNKIIKLLNKQKKLSDDFLYLLKPKKLVTILPTATVDQAKKMMKKGGVSRLIVTDNMGKLAGILTRHELRQALREPKFSQSSGSRKGDKVKSLNHPISTYMKTQVVTSSAKKQVAKLINLMFTQKVGSIVLVDKSQRPTGLITTKDVLNILATKAKSASLKKLVTSYDHRFTAKKEFNLLVDEIFSKLNSKFGPLSLKAKIDIIQNPVKKITHHKVSFVASIEKQGKKAAKKIASNWQVALNTAFKRLVTQLSKK